VIFLFAVRSKRYNLGQVSGYDIVGTFNGSIDTPIDFIKQFGDKSQHLRLWEALAHVVAFFCGVWYLIDTKGVTDCHNNSFMFLMLLSIVAYFLCMSAEVYDGWNAKFIQNQTADGEKTVTLEQSPTTTQRLAVWITVVSVTNFIFTVLRLDRSHTDGIVCDGGTNAILAMVFFLSVIIMVVYIGSYTAPTSMYRLAQKRPNTVVSWLGFISFVLVAVQYGTYETSGKDTATAIGEYTGKNFCKLLVCGSHNSTIIAPCLENIQSYVTDDTVGNNYLMAHFGILAVMAVGTLCVYLFIIMPLNTKYRIDNTEEERTHQEVYNTTALRPANDSAGLARNRLTGDGTKPYTSVSTLQFV